MQKNPTYMTFEQQRAQAAWQACAQYQDAHVKAAKGLPALIMNSGLMQVLAFCEEKSAANGKVADDLRTWLAFRFPSVFDTGAEFNSFMQALIKADSPTYQAIHAEAFAWLKWLRQLAAARIKER
ncbi:MAG: type III-B CRISPR module-associated protein Cmr5 [Burkholderiaceae bacterium]